MTTLCEYDERRVCTRCRQPESMPGFLRNCCGRPNCWRRKRGLGDLVKAVLSAIGITEQRVSAAIGRPCGCSQRAEKLNDLGRRIGIG